MDYKMQFAESLSNIFTNELTQKQILDLMKHRNKMNWRCSVPMLFISEAI